MAKQTVIITGGNSGLGFECARTMARSRDWHIVIASRNAGRVNAAVEQLKAESGTQSIEGMVLDLGSLVSVRAFYEEFMEGNRPVLQAIICNAGLSLTTNSLSTDGFDMTFGVNHLGHYLLVHLFSDTIADDGRVVFVSSGTHIPGHHIASRMGVTPPKYVTAHDLAFADAATGEAKIDSPVQRYSTSKLCNVLSTYEFARQFEAANKQIGVFAIDPGLMVDTELLRDVPRVAAAVFRPVINLIGRFVDGIRHSSESGQHLARLAADPALAEQSGLYFDGVRREDGSPDSYDVAKAHDLWNTSAGLVGLREAETILPLVV